MARNRAHRVNPQELIDQIINGPPSGTVKLLVMSIDKFLNNEIAATVTHKSPQTSLLFMGIYSVALTLAEVLFDERSIKGYKKFLEVFIDSNTDNRRFSLIAKELHSWRNILVHGWLSLRGHSIEYDYDMEEGFKKQGGDLYINPKIYLDLYLTAFNKNGRLWLYVARMTESDLLRAQQVIKQKYLR